MKSLLLTLGHNSSAILIEDNQLKWGYETERLSGIKSDSTFPQLVLDRMKVKPDVVYVTHWSPDGNLSSMGAKYWNPEVFDGIPIRTLSPERSHHDTHIAGAKCYAGPNFPYGNNTIGLVIDGFGIYGENLSVYRFDAEGKYTLVERVHGYATSLGLWYQYSTAFMGLKMHEDEYKLLGYEVHVDYQDAALMTVMAKSKAETWADDMRTSVYGSKMDPMYNLNALASVKEHIWDHLFTVCKALGITDPSSHEGRCKLAFYVQAVLEHVVCNLVDRYEPTNIIAAGGVFYNVKLNLELLKCIEGQICVYPLCGDQGNAIGLYAMDHPEFVFPKNLNWGVRELKSLGEVPGLLVIDEEVAGSYILTALRNKGRVNLVRGNMEFGPRAMCNTSTLAMPNMDQVSAINYCNNRNTVMPMAPVMTAAMYHALYERTHQVWKSASHMVMAMEHFEYPLERIRGVTHGYAYPYNHHTGRPQVIADDDHLMQEVLGSLGHPLINTSFNYHGNPICLDMDSIIKNHMLEYTLDNSTTTLVIKNV